MRPGDIYKNKSNENIGIRLERYINKNDWEVQTVDFKENKAIRSFIFETANVNKIFKFYYLVPNWRN